MSVDWNYVEYRLLTFGIAVFVVLSVISCVRGCETDKSTWYYGAAYDYEFDGESTGKAQGLDIRSSSLKGGTVIGEAGYVYNPNEKWTIDSTLFGFAGQRDGFGGQVNVTYHF